MWFRKNSNRTGQGRGLFWSELLWSLSWTRKGRAPWSRRQTLTHQILVCPGLAQTVTTRWRRPLPLLRSTIFFLWVKHWLLPLMTNSRPGQPRPSASGISRWSLSLSGRGNNRGTPKRSTITLNINWTWRLDTSFFPFLFFFCLSQTAVFNSLKQTK